MRLPFDANQDFQLDAIRAPVDLFRGQPAAFEQPSRVSP